MSQHDLNIANQGFPATRADINSALVALGSNSSGATEPTTTYAYQFWYDETTDTLKMRNADNDAWITIGTFNQATDIFTPAGLTTDKIEEGNSSVEVVDTGTGYVAVTVDGAEKMRFASGALLQTDANTPALEIQGNTTGSSTAGTGSTLAFNGNSGSGSPWEIYRENGSSGDLKISVNSSGTRIDAMSIDLANQDFRFNSGYGSVETAYGCRAWANIDGTGTVGTRADGNISSVTFDSASYTVSLSTAMPDGNYSVNLTMQRPSGDGSSGGSITLDKGTTLSASAFAFYVWDSSFGVIDAETICVSVFR